MQSVIQRPKIGIDLVAQGSGQEAEPLPRFHRRPGQDDPADFLVLERLHGFRHCQVRLAGTRRTDAEDHRVPVDGVNIVLLVQGLGPDGPAPAGKDVVRQHVHGVLHGLGPQEGNQLLQHVRSDHCSLGHQPPDFLQEPHDPRNNSRRPGHGQLVATNVEIDVGKLILDVAQGLIMAAQRVNHLIGVVERDDFRARAR